MSLLESLNWRYATKRMTGQKVPQEKVNIILEAARLAPTGSGIQPFSIVQITDKALLEKVQKVAFNQPQITEASHLLVFTAWDHVTPEKIDYVYDQIAKERGLPADALKDYTDRLKTMFGGMTPEQQFNWAARQAYIAFGVAIAAAATEKVDATPMEGFVNAELDQLLELPKRGLRSTSLLTLGYRDTVNDWLANLKKVRRPIEELVIEL
jgi:nitroreductase / dihydropteridine reductase